MKKGLILTHLVFNSMAIICIVLWTILLGLYINLILNDITDETYHVVFVACWVILWILTLASIVGTGITSICLIVCSKGCNSNLLKIIGIVGVASAIIGLIPEILFFVKYLGFSLLIFYIIGIVNFSMTIRYYKNSKQVDSSGLNDPTNPIDPTKPININKRVKFLFKSKKI